MAGTEEPEDGRRTSTLLRSRRAGTEELEDPLDRKPILSRGRRSTLDNGEDESRFRTPSRAITEVNGLRPREYISQLPPTSYYERSRYAREFSSPEEASWFHDSQHTIRTICKR